MTENIKSDPGRKVLSGTSACGVLFDARDEFSRALLKSFLRAVLSLNLSVALLGLDKKKNALPPPDVPYTAVTSADFNLFGRLKNGSAAAAFTRKHFDLLVDLSLSPAGRAEKIVRRTPAAFRVGVNKTSDAFDFHFEMPATAQENPEAFVQMLSCLEKVKIEHP